VSSLDEEITREIIKDYAEQYYHM
jgi:hypothetical protein